MSLQAADARPAGRRGMCEARLHVKPPAPTITRRTEENSMIRWLRTLFSAGVLTVLATSALAADKHRDAESFEVSESNLLVVLRESPGANKQGEDLQPFGKIHARMPDGREVEFEASWF